MNLELVATDELLDELFSRYDHAIFSALKDPAPPSHRRKACQRIEGFSLTTAGLAADIEHQSLHALSDAKQEDQHP
jgi:hypothetical protein